MKWLLICILCLMAIPAASAFQLSDTLINLSVANTTIDLSDCTWTFDELQWSGSWLYYVNLTVDNPLHATPMTANFTESNQRYNCSTFPYNGTTPTGDDDDSGDETTGGGGGGGGGSSDEEEDTVNATSTLIPEEDEAPPGWLESILPDISWPSLPDSVQDTLDNIADGTKAAYERSKSWLSGAWDWTKENWDPYGVYAMYGLVILSLAWLLRDLLLQFGITLFRGAPTIIQLVTGFFTMLFNLVMSIGGILMGLVMPVITFLIGNMIGWLVLAIGAIALGWWVVVTFI